MLQAFCFFIAGAFAYRLIGGLLGIYVTKRLFSAATDVVAHFIATTYVAVVTISTVISFDDEISEEEKETRRKALLDECAVWLFSTVSNLSGTLPAKTSKELVAKIETGINQRLTNTKEILREK